MASPAKAQGKLLALDIGLARIGVAVCDPLRLGARPLLVIRRTSRNADFEQIARLVRQQEVVGVICGLPLNMDGSEGPQSETVRKWAKRLAAALHTLLGHSLPILFWDERLSTFAAQEILADTAPLGQIKKTADSTKKHVGEDAAAAAVILQDYLDAQQRGAMVDFGTVELSQK